MNEIFLSAGVPEPAAGEYHRTANPYLIQLAVRELVISIAGRCRIVWGGQPAITPMVADICYQLGIEIGDAFLLYQSRLFEGRFPKENAVFDKTVLTDAIDGDLEKSLAHMRDQMLSRPSLKGAVFIGGKEGVLAEYGLFGKKHPDAPVIAVASTGGAALAIAKELEGADEQSLGDVAFSTMFNRLPC